jgi:hypothetical protein
MQLKLQEKEKRFELDLQKRYEIMLQQFQEKVAHLVAIDNLFDRWNVKWMFIGRKLRTIFKTLGATG